MTKTAILRQSNESQLDYLSRLLIIHNTTIYQPIVDHQIERDLETYGGINRSMIKQALENNQHTKEPKFNIIKTGQRVLNPETGRYNTTSIYEKKGR